MEEERYCLDNDVRSVLVIVVANGLAIIKDVGLPNPENSL
jgi:hypothetical protein